MGTITSIRKIDGHLRVKGELRKIRDSVKLDFDIEDMEGEVFRCYAWREYARKIYSQVNLNQRLSVRVKETAFGFEVIGLSKKNTKTKFDQERFDENQDHLRRIESTPAFPEIEEIMDYFGAKTWSDMLRREFGSYEAILKDVHARIQYRKFVSDALALVRNSKLF